jgi:hypothetical protein
MRYQAPVSDSRQDICAQYAFGEDRLLISQRPPHSERSGQTEVEAAGSEDDSERDHDELRGMDEASET